jgi:Ras-related GTP-binding protein C/D
VGQANGASAQSQGLTGQEDADRKKILVLGPRKYVFIIDKDQELINRAGKSSCIKTVFQNVPVKDVPFFGVTQRVEKINYE